MRFARPRFCCAVSVNRQHPDGRRAARPPHSCTCNCTAAAPVSGNPAAPQTPLGRRFTPHTSGPPLQLRLRPTEPLLRLPTPTPPRRPSPSTHTPCAVFRVWGFGKQRAGEGREREGRCHELAHTGLSIREQCKRQSSHLPPCFPPPPPLHPHTHTLPCPALHHKLLAHFPGLKTAKRKMTKASTTKSFTMKALCLDTRS